MKSATLVFPHQLFKDHPAILEARPVYVIEEALFFNQYNFHKQKLILHRSTMKMYSRLLEENEMTVEYIQAIDPLSDIRELLCDLAKKGIQEIHYANVVDNWLEKRIRTTCATHSIKAIIYETPNFLNTLHSVTGFFSKKTKYLQTDFYIWQRRQLKILLSANSQPEGGKWTYDADNRMKFPKDELPPEIGLPEENDYVKEARQYIHDNFNSNYGELTPPIHLTKKAQPDSEAVAGFYPTTYEEAAQWLDDFLQTRFQKFGVYQDAMVGNSHYLHHSVLTPMLNIGLLNPKQIIEKAIKASAKHDVPLNSLEGFIRQIIGWREFIRIIYEKEGSKQRTTNFWKFTRKIPPTFWKGETGIVPVDIVIHKLLATGYSHHIERLMVMANFMLLCEFDPDEVYRWFMEMYVDSYDWVMVPNVYGMTQFADGGLMATKPYISGSNYLMKMSDYKKGPWQEIWDGLFWRFMHVNRDFFIKNPRLGMLLKTFDKMPQAKRDRHLANAEKYLAGLDEVISLC
ncbi:MAG: cryptochrome/photolyase family protein [Chitinophagaceae bacterium]